MEEETVELILTDVVANCNKVWKAKLLADGSVQSEWGRVGYPLQTTDYPASRGGRRFFEKKIAEKKKKGYSELRTIGGPATKTKTVQNSALGNIAKEQIKTGGNSVLTALIDRLVAANVHAITSNTSISYNVDSGLFQTPLGIVDSSVVREARDCLNDLWGRLQKGQRGDAKSVSLANQYFRLIPSNFGMKRINIADYFGTQEAFQKQVDILDSLESSFQAFSSQPKTDEEKKEVVEKVFDLSIDIETSSKRQEIIDFYYKGRQTMHRGVYHLKPKEVYKISCPFMEERFLKDEPNVWELWHGSKVCNILSIMKSGLKISPPTTASIAGKNYGNGVYFSDQSTKSLNYATSFWGGRSYAEYFMFLSQVAMGNYQVPRRSTSSNPDKGYDSYFAKGNESGVLNNEMIVFDERRINLTHLVEFA